MFWYDDWFASPLRGELATEADHLTRMVYLEVLFKLHESGGNMKRTDVAGSLLISKDEAEKALSRLLASGRLTCEDGIISNEKVAAQLVGEQEFRLKQSERGKRSWAARKPRPRSGGRASVKPAFNAGSTSVELLSHFRSTSSPSPASASLPLPLPLEQTLGATTAARLTAILNAVSGRRLSRNKAVEDLSDKAIAAGYPPDEQLGALWGGLCGKDEWWRSETGGDCDLTLLLRYKGGLNTTTGKEAKRWLADLQKYFPAELFPAWVREACEKLRAAGLEAEVEWLKARGARGSS